MSTSTGQERVIDFLTCAENYSHSGPVEVIHTHCAHLFLVGDDVYKIKRAISFSYLDMSSLESRYHLCKRELELNQKTLPDIYLDLVSICEADNGSLELNGSGEPVEWAIHMRRFNETSVLDHMATNGQLEIDIAASLGSSIAEYHSGLQALDVNDGHARIHEVVKELVQELGLLDHVFSKSEIEGFRTATSIELERCMELMDERARAGFIRRCHGDLHLRNLIMHKGVPTPFDALEFDERMATTDVLYDLAFLLMDLCHRDLTEQSNAVLNHYFLHSKISQLQGLSLLPIFLACRACIRAMTTAQAIKADLEHQFELRSEAISYLQSSRQFLKRQAPVLIAIGGLSGTGKSTLSQKLASSVVKAPGALLLHSDAERKVAEGVDEKACLPDERYTKEASNENYNRLRQKTSIALAADWPVIVDAVFLRYKERFLIEQCADEYGCRFVGIWLTADTKTLQQRIAARVNDISDATVAVLDLQLLQDQGPMTWQTLNTHCSRASVFEQASKIVSDLLTSDIQN
jgi:aminoglycoside phosphotransferase family enzyme/adenylate kinase family enzyme